MSTSIPPAIDVRGVRRVYKAKPRPVVALDGVDLAVEPGEFFGLLGPNGAGKTTLIKILTTLLLPTEGTARVFGFDVERQTTQIRRIMNIVSGGEQSGYGLLQVREQLWMFSQFYGLRVARRLAPRRRADGGRRASPTCASRRCRSSPPASARSSTSRAACSTTRGSSSSTSRPWDWTSPRRAPCASWCVDWRAAVPGRTILLTSHYMAEVDELCERLAIVDHGRILAIGSPCRAQAPRAARVDLPARAGPARRRLERARPAARRRQRRRPRRTAAMARPRTDRPCSSAWCSPRTRRSAASSPRSGGLGAHIVALQKSEPSLEDVFVELVGRGARGRDGRRRRGGTACGEVAQVGEPGLRDR